MPDFYRSRTISLSSSDVDCIQSALNPPKTSTTSPNPFYSAHVSRVAQSLTTWSSRLWPHSQINTMRCMHTDISTARLFKSITWLIDNSFWVTVQHVKVLWNNQVKHISLFTPLVQFTSWLHQVLSPSLHRFFHRDSTLILHQSS